MQKLAVAVIVFGLVACQATKGEEVSEVGSISKHIKGGDSLFSIDGICLMDIALPDTDPPVMSQDPIKCTCTLIDAQVIITAASCVEQNVEKNKLMQPADIDIKFGTTSYEFEEIKMHRYYDPDSGGLNDIALIRLKTAPNETVHMLNTRPLTAADQSSGQVCETPTGAISDVAGCTTVFGFGETEDDMGNFGTLRRIATPIEVVEPRHVLVGTQVKNTCDGDSGGPVFADFGSGPVLIGVSERQSTCRPSVRRTRIDAYLDTFIYPYLDQFSGACQTDGSVCTTTGCRTPDRDCAENECLWGNTCKEDCPTRDWDCDLGKFIGEICTASGECEELGQCIAARDDATQKHCSRPCDPMNSDTCPTTHECIDDGAGGNECAYALPSPGSQGADCDFCPPGIPGPCCTSGICEEQICVNQCATQADCDSGFTCGASTVTPGTMVCLGEVFSGGGGFCNAQGDSDPRGLLVLALFVAAMLGWRRRRRLA